MAKPRLGTVPFSAKQIPPTTGFMPIIAQCPQCGRMAFGIIEQTKPSLVGQQVKTRLCGVECPWCLTISQTTPEGEKQLLTLPLDMAAQVRRDLTAAPLAADTEAGGLLATHEQESSNAEEGIGQA